MNSGNKPTVSIQIGSGFAGVLGVMLITFKAMGVIDWSWWIVLAPIYAPPVILVGVLLGLLLFWHFIK